MSSALKRLFLCFLLSPLLFHASDARKFYEENRVRSIKCPQYIPEKEGFICARTRVPLDYRQPANKEVDLWITILKGKLRTPKSEAVTVLPGGPGQSWSELLKTFTNSTAWKELQTLNQPIALVDPRGTGLSSPLNCSQSLSPTALAQNKTLAEVCSETIGPDRIHYNTANIVRDVEVVRKRLLVRKWNMIGVSYGASVASTYVDLFPKSARTVTLDSANVNADRARGTPRLYKANLRVLNSICSRFYNCSVPKLLSDLDKTLVQIRNNASLTTVTPNTLALDALDPEIVRNMTVALDKAAGGNFSELEEVVARKAGAQDVSLSLGLFFSVICLETRLPWDLQDNKTEQLIKYATVLNQTEKSTYLPFEPLEYLLLISVPTFCIGWGPLPQGASKKRLVVNPLGPIDNHGTKVFVLGGEFDLRTTIAEGRRVAKRFSNSRFAKIANAGHSLIGISDCARSLIIDFVRSARYPDVNRCADPKKQPLEL